MSVLNLTAAPPTVLRSEVEVVADAVTTLIHAGVIRPNALTYRTIADECGIEINDLRRAEARWSDLGRPPRPLRVVHRVADLPLDPTPLPGGRGVKNPTPRIGTSLRGVRTTDKNGQPKNPTPDTRRCNQCQEVKPVSEFGYKSRANGTLRSYCKPCQSAWSRARWLSLTRLDQLGQIGVGLVAVDGDTVIGLICPCCDSPIAAGERYRVDGLPAHETCIDPGVASADVIESTEVNQSE